MKTVLYARSSIKSQEHSIGMQKSLAFEKIKTEGIKFDAFYLDEAVSARKTEMHERPELNRMIQDIEKGLISTIYVYKRDRLARNVIQSMELFSLLRSKQIKVIFTAANELPIQYSPVGEFFELIIAGFNEREANQIVQRIKETKYTMTEQGKHAQGRIAYGYTVNKEKEYLINHSQAANIKKLYDDMITTTCVSFSDFAKGIQKQSWCPKKWDNNRIHNLIANPIYKGIRKLEKYGEFVEIENARLRIIDETIWDQAQEKMNRLKQTRKRRKYNRVPMMLDDLLYCDKCDSKMFGRQVCSIPPKIVYTCKKHSYIQIAPEFLEKTLLEECAKLVTRIFQSHFPEVYELVQKDRIKSFEKSIKESHEDIKVFRQQLIESTSTWIKDPSSVEKELLLELHNKIKLGELVQKVYPEWLAESKAEYHMIGKLIHSVDLIAEVPAYDADSRATFIRDIVHRIGINASSLSIQLRDPFIGKKVVIDVTGD